jgi:hypothetical protein
MRNELLELHRAILEAEKRRYEAGHGRIESSGEALQIVINDPQFAWELLQQAPDVVVAHGQVASRLA